MILDGDYGEAYFASSHRIGAVHYRLGVSSSAYLGAYRHLVASLIRLANRQSWGHRLLGRDRGAWSKRWWRPPSSTWIA